MKTPLKIKIIYAWLIFRFVASLLGVMAIFAYGGSSFSAWELVTLFITLLSSGLSLGSLMTKSNSFYAIFTFAMVFNIFLLVLNIISNYSTLSFLTLIFYLVQIVIDGWLLLNSQKDLNRYLDINS